MDGITTIRDVARAEAPGLPADLPASTYEMIRRGANLNPDAPALSFFLTTDEHRKPETWSYRTLLEDITRTGLGSGLEFEEIKLQPEVVQQFYIELPIKISVVGGYHDLATFVSGVASLSRIVTLHDFEIKPLKDGSASKLRMAITAKTYRYNDKGVTP